MLGKDLIQEIDFGALYREQCRRSSFGARTSADWDRRAERRSRGEGDRDYDRALLARLDLAFSRDQAQKVYLQDRLRESAGQVRQWLDQGAAIYICGSLQGMAAGVDQALIDMLGAEAVELLIEQGRYRRDVY